MMAAKSSLQKLMQVFCTALLPGSLAAISTPALSAEVETWQIKQQTEQLGPTTVLMSSDSVKFIGNDGDLIVVARKPTWRVVAFNRSEKVGFEVPLSEWPRNGLKLFKGPGELLTGKKSQIHDPQLKMDLLQLEIPLQGRYYGNNDPAIFRAAEKKQLLSSRLRVSTTIPVNEDQKKFLAGLYSLAYPGGFPLQLSTLTTDGGISYTYRTVSVCKTKTDSSTFDYPTKYKITGDRMDVLVTSRQKKRFEDFLDAFTDDAADEKAKSVKKPPR
ncbi:MAG: hypothetical protein U0103_02030 [Candidatus Obscuribacterales bacterium]